VANRPERIGKYEITDTIGEGGMGAVYKGTDPRIGRTVAIKVIKGDFADNPELLKRFYHEAQAVGNLQHPNIVVVYDLGEESGSPFLVMEYLNGVPLDKIIAQRQSVSIVQKLGIVIEVLDALHYAHQRNIVHRDVKPANVMVLKDSHIKLLDFGIARQGDLGQTKTNQLMGTMWYMSPEQLNGQIVDGRSDVFSTGIMLFEVLAYSLPFSTNDMTYVVKRLKGDPPPLLSTYLQAYPSELDDIIARSLALDREHRYSTAEEFAFELGRLQDRLKRDMVSHYVDQARDSIARSDLAKARELLSEVLRVDTQNQTAKQLLYEIQQTLQKSARNEKKKHLKDQAADALATKQLEVAEKLAEEAIRLDATDTDLLNLREQIELAKLRTQQVKKLLTLAKVAQQTGELAVAKKAIDDALKLDPQDTDAKLMRSAIDRLMVEYEKQRQIQQLLGAARREIESRQFAAAEENIAKAKVIDAAYAEIPGLERMLRAGREQESRQRDLAQLRSQIEQKLSAGRARAARDIAAGAMRKFSGEQEFVRLKSMADAALEKEERRAYIDERIATASRLVQGGEATRAARLLKDIEREYPEDTRLRESIEAVQQAIVRESVAREKHQLLQRARDAMRGKAFSEAIKLLEGGSLQFPEDSAIKDLLKTAREELDLLSKKKQVEEVKEQAHDLLYSRAHTDAIRLLERTAAQVSDPELVNLLQYARQEAAKFRAAMQDANNQATQMLSVGKPAEAVTYLEAQANKYGKNADFQVLLEQARKQAKEAERAKERLLVNLRDARAKLRAEDIHGAEALLHVCEVENADNLGVLALATEIEEQKKAIERRRAEAERLAKDKAEAERKQVEAERLAQEKTAAERQRAEAERLAKKKQEAERREIEAAREREAIAPVLPPAISEPSFGADGATVLDRGSGESLPTLMMPPVSGGPAAGVVTGRAAEEAEISVTQLITAHAAAVESAVLTPPPIDVVPSPAAPEPAAAPPPTKTKQEKKESKEKQIAASAAAAEAVVTPGPEKPQQEAPLPLRTIVKEPKPVMPPGAPHPAKPLPIAPPEIQPPGNKRPIFMAGGAVTIIMVAVVVWVVAHHQKPTKVAQKPPVAATGVPETPQTPKPTTAILKIIGAPPGAKYRVGNDSGTVADDGTAQIEIKPGTYPIEMNAPNYKPYSGSVTLEPGHNEPLTPPLVPADVRELGTLIVKANVDHFDVLIDGKLRSNSGKGQQVRIEHLPEASYTIVIRKSDYGEPKSQSVKIAANMEKLALFKLNPNAPTDTTLSVTLRPAGKIVIDDGSAIDLPGGSYTGKVIPGSHKVEASSNGYQTQSKSVTAKAGEPVFLSFELPPISASPKLETKIVSFTAVPDKIDQGQSAKLKWETEGATQVAIDAFGNKSFDPKSEIDVRPDKDTTYVLTAMGPSGSKSESRKITVLSKVVPAQSATDEVKIQDVLKAYERALQDKDESELRLAWPKISDKELSRTRKFFESVADLTVKVRVTDGPVIKDNLAQVTCLQNLHFKDLSSSSPKDLTTSVLFTLVRLKNGDWVIQQAK